MKVGRKATLYFVSMIILTVALFLGKITGSEWINGNSVLFGLFVVGNVGEHFSEKKKK